MDRAEAAGFGVAVACHAALLAALTLGLAAVATGPAPRAFEVAFVDEVGLASAAPAPAVEPPAPGRAPEAGPPDDGAAAPLAEAAPRPSAPAPLPSPQAAPARERPAPAQRATGAGERARRPLIGDDLLKGIGRDRSPSRTERPPAAMTGEARASINAAIRRALIPCERQPLPTPEAASIEVDVRVTLDRGGGLVDADVLRVRNDDGRLEIYERRMRDLALNVIRQCTPIRGLPAELYDVPRGWRQFTYTFDPRQGR